VAANGAQFVLTIVNRLKLFAADDRGVTAIEYGVIATVLGMALVPVLSSTTSGMGSLFTRVQDYFTIVNGG
jgi:pilus assembly protein Flp/PilA